VTDFAVTGKKRSGKGLFCAGLIRDALRDGRKVATNMDIYPEHLVSPTNKNTLIRLPDCPTAEDMEHLGRGYVGDYDDDKNGLIILDEASKFFNARQWGDKGRQPLLDWLIHSGKLGWDVYYQMQGLEQVDKQLRNTQVEYHVAVKRTDRWPIPGVTALFSVFGFDVRFPRMHLGIIKHGVERDSLVVDRKWYKSKDIVRGYDTRQVFLDREHPMSVGIHSVLSAWHVKGRYLPKPPSVFMRFLYGIIGYDWSKSSPPPVRKPKHPYAVVLGKLPERQAIEHFRRLDALGAFN